MEMSLKRTYKPKPYITTKMVYEEIEPNLDMIQSIIGLDTYKEALKTKYCVGQYAVDDFNWVFLKKKLMLTPVDDELPDWA